MLLKWWKWHSLHFGVICLLFLEKNTNFRRNSTSLKMFEYQCWMLFNTQWKIVTLKRDDICISYVEKRCVLLFQGASRTGYIINKMGLYLFNFIEILKSLFLLHYICKWKKYCCRYLSKILFHRHSIDWRFSLARILNLGLWLVLCCWNDLVHNFIYYYL